jgi:serine/threonine-protein kinase
MIEVGEIVGGKYRVLRALGEGGMGLVVAAEHLHVSEPVAIKVLKRDALVRPEMVARFVREARTAMKLKSEHVVRVFDVDMLGGSVPYIVMELLVGRDLSTTVAEDGPLDVRDAIDWVLQACEAIAEAHALGIVHRDLKPANLFVTKRADGSASIKVLDFGVSKVAWASEDVGGQTEPSSDPKIAAARTASPVSSASASLTSTNATLGSPRYMSPEQLRSARDVDTRADVWALGATLFELLAGRAPFVGETTEELTARIAEDPTPSLRRFRPNVPAALDGVVARALAKDPDARFADIAAFASALSPFGSPDGLRSAARAHATLGHPIVRRRKGARVWIASGVALFALAPVVAWLAVHGTRAQPAPRAATTVVEPPASTTRAAPSASASDRPVMVVTSTSARRTAPARASASAVKPDAGFDPAHAFDQPD